MMKRAKVLTLAVSMMAAGLLLFAEISPAFSQTTDTSDSDVSIDGILSVVHVDEVDPAKSRYEYFVEDVKTKVMTQLFFKLPPKALLRTGDKVRVKGRRMHNTLNVTDFTVGGSTDTSGLTSANGTVAAAATPHHAIVMVVNMTGAPYTSTTPPYDNAVVTQAAALMFGSSYSVNTVYNESSFSQMNFPGSVANVVLVSVPYDNTCQYYTISNNADTAAQLAGVNLSLYQHRVYLVPPAQISGCSWLALGQIGNYGSTAVYRSWSTRNDSLAYAHELGHNLGWHHAATDPNNDGTLDVEYGDTSDLMGYCCNKRKINSVHSDQIGWFNSGTLASRVVNVTAPGVYVLSPLGSDPLTTVNPQILKITPPDNSRTYYLSYRRPIGFDATIASRYTTGVNVHRGLKADRWSYEIDVLNNDTRSTFTDSVNGISIHQLASDATQVTVDIGFGACVKRNPSVALSPSTQAVATSGGTAAYTTTVTNNDSVGCEQASFAMTAVGNGMTGTFQTAVLTLKPGASDTTAMNVQAAMGVADGSYQLTVKAADQNLPVGQHEGSAIASLQVDTQAPVPPSSVSASQKKVQGKLAVQLAWPQAVDSTGGTGVASYRAYRNGTLLGETTSTSIADRTATTGTSYTYTVHSVDRVGHVSLTPASTNFTLGTGGGPKGR
jgi:hypothetical protein